MPHQIPFQAVQLISTHAPTNTAQCLVFQPKRLGSFYQLHCKTSFTVKWIEISVSSSRKVILRVLHVQICLANKFVRILSFGWIKLRGSHAMHAAKQVCLEPVKHAACT